MRKDIEIITTIKYLDNTTKTRKTYLNSSVSGFNDLFIVKGTNEYVFTRYKVVNYEITNIKYEGLTIYITLGEQE